MAKRLRGDFIFSFCDGPGPQRPIDVSLASADFIALRNVPPLCVHTLLLAQEQTFSRLLSGLIGHLRLLR